MCLVCQMLPVSLVCQYLTTPIWFSLTFISSFIDERRIVNFGFSVVRVTRSFVLCVMFCRSLLVRLSFFLAMVLSVLRFTDYDYHFGIFKPSNTNHTKTEINYTSLVNKRRNKRVKVIIICQGLYRLTIKTSTEDLRETTK
jgi:hypothetical protein